MSHSNQITHDQSEPNSRVILTSVVVMFIFLLVVIWGSLIFYFATTSEERDTKVETYVMPSYSKFKDIEIQELDRLGYVKGHFKLPINLAKELMIKKYR